MVSGPLSGVPLQLLNFYLNFDYFDLFFHSIYSHTIESAFTYFYNCFKLVFRNSITLILYESFKYYNHGDVLEDFVVAE